MHFSEARALPTLPARPGSEMIRTFQILAVIIAAVAAYFLWAGNKDGVFVSIVLAACSFFLSIRFQAKARLDERNAVATETDDILRK